MLPLLFLAVGGQPPIVMAQSAGTFTATGSMTTSRFFHTATLLTDGRVLIAGGDMAVGRPSLPPSFKTLSSAELYDPRTGTFTATGDMTIPRSRHTATLLPDGKVLIAGGGVTNAGSLADSALASAELYDPDTGTFSAVADMTTARSFATATMLDSGKILIAGGSQRSAELYDPSTGTFTPTGNMTSEWADTATLLPNGKVLITRGNPEGPPPYLSSAELYDPSTGTFTFAGYMTTNHTGPTATLLPNGKVFVAGGDVGDGDGASNIAELFDPATGTFTIAGNMIAGRDQHTATLLPDGKVLLAGGHTLLAATAEFYDPVTNTFSATGNLAGKRELHSATVLNDGRVLIAGGDDERYWVPDTILASAEIYHPAAVQGTPTVRIVDNNTGSLTTLAIGDSFSFQVTGAPPVSLVSVSEAGWSGSLGYTDASGLFFLNGIVGSNVVGTWQQTWTIGGVLAQPGPLQFTITPKP
jgi:WD40 repeat protein